MSGGLIMTNIKSNTGFPTSYRRIAVKPKSVVDYVGRPNNRLLQTSGPQTENVWTTGFLYDERQHEDLNFDDRTWRRFRIVCAKCSHLVEVRADNSEWKTLCISVA